MPGQLTPMRGSVVTDARLNLRRGSPDTSAPIVSKVDPGTALTVVGLIEGRAVSGNPRWYAGENDTFFWSGACGAFQAEAATGSAPAAVHRRPDGTVRPLADSEIKTVFGNPAFVEADKGAVTLDAGWANHNIVELAAPTLAAAGYARIRVHKKAADAFQQVFAAITSAGLDHLIRTCAGTFVPRHKGWDPTRGLSSHTWGIAIDLNVPWNGYGAVPAPIGAIGSVRELVPVFESCGFAWGGYFSPQKYCDGMHFELARYDL